MKKIRYTYRPTKEGFRLDNVRCPTCRRGINWVKPVGNCEYQERVVLLAQCWSGSSSIEKPEHLFLIEIKDLPKATVSKVRKR